MTALKPKRRADGKLVTLENCGADECRWPYGEVSPRMVLCGRPIVPHKAYCADHLLARLRFKAKP